MMQVYRDILTQELATEYRFEREIEFAFQNAKVVFDSGLMKVVYSETELKSLTLDLQVNASQQAHQLKALFESCGYSDLHEVSALIFSPGTTVWLCFEALPEVLAEMASAFFLVQELPDFLETDLPEKGKRFKALDQVYRLIKVDVRTQE